MKVDAIKINKYYKMQDESTGTYMFRICQQKILAALGWLKMHNPLYAYIEIAKENLQWMNGKDEKDLDIIVVDNSIDESIVTSDTNALSNNDEQLDDDDNDTMSITNNSIQNSTNQSTSKLHEIYNQFNKIGQILTLD
jgi:hypothetical protein